MTCDLYTGWSHNVFLRHDRRRRLTLVAVLVCLSVDPSLWRGHRRAGVRSRGRRPSASRWSCRTSGWARGSPRCRRMSPCSGALSLSPALGQWAVRPAFFHIHPARMTQWNATRQPIRSARSPQAPPYRELTVVYLESERREERGRRNGEK